MKWLVLGVTAVVAYGAITLCGCARRSRHEFVDYAVTCARCKLPGTTATFVIEEGDEWECPSCWAFCEAEQRAMLAKGKGHDVT